jgi:outer membrane receptor protein involved in Fe transport
MRRKVFPSLRASAPPYVVFASCVMFLAGLSPALVASDSGSPDQGARAGSIAGTVAVAETGQPVSNALVRILGTNLQATTRSSGHFTIPDVPEGVIQVSAIAPGYLETVLGDIRVTAGTATPLQIKLQPTPNFMEKVTVAASKEPLSIGEVPGQADIIDQMQIARTAAITLPQAIVNVPGVMVSNVVANITDVTLRGIPTSGFPFASTLLLIDGVPQTDSRNSATGVNVPLDDVGSIEVIRGPNAAVYGRTAIAGSVNVLTPDPTLEHRVTFDGQIGEFDYVKGGAKASGPIHNWGGYYISLSSSKDNGYTKQSYDYKDDQNSLFAKFTFTPDNESHGYVTLSNIVSDVGRPTYIPIIDGQFLFNLDPRFDRLTNLDLPTSNFHQEDLRTTLSYRRQLTSWLEFVDVFSYHHLQYKWTDDGDGIGAPFDLSSQTVTMYPFEQTLNERTFYEDGHFVIRPRLGDISNSLLVGVSYDQTAGFASGNLIYTDPNTLGWPLNYLTDAFPARNTWQYFPFGGNDYRLAITAAFAQYIISPTRRLEINVGGRYDNLDLTDTKDFAQGKPTINDSFHAFSPKVSATVKLLGTDAAAGKGALNAYAVYSTAFLPPRTPSSLTPVDEVIRLQPVKLKNYEVGLKSNLLSGKLSLEGTFFKMNEDGVVIETRVGPFYQLSNAGAEDFRGVEVGATWRPITELSLYANAAFYHNRYGNFVIQSSSGNDVLTGNRFPLAPDQVYSAGATFEHRSGWEATLNVKHVGSVFLDQNNTFLLAPWTVVDASLSWRHDAVRLTLGGHNLFNQNYYDQGDTAETPQYVNPAPPRQVVFKASFSFK